MIYLKRFDLMSEMAEERFLNDFNRTCFESYYPMMMFPNKQLDSVEFSDITIFCGGNGSGKSTLLNIMAEKLGLERSTPYNKTYFFEPYLQHCEYEMTVCEPLKVRGFMNKSRIITSDDVFNHIIEVRERNENLDFKRRLIFKEKRDMNREGFKYPRFSSHDPDSVKEYMRLNQMSKMSASSFVKRNIGVDERTYSNGENGFRYFTDAIQPDALYLLDEPENSLSAEMQQELAHFIQGMAKFYNCQFVLSTHSPFLLSMMGARIYNMDAVPVSVSRWTELSNVRILHEFFKDHSYEFED
jgi:predicted ATPase